jgi:hypothetical protein
VLGLILLGVRDHHPELRRLPALPGGTQQHWLWIGLGTIGAGFHRRNTRWR